MVMFLLSFVKGVQIRGGESISASGFGPGGPILGGSKSAGTPACQSNERSREGNITSPYKTPALQAVPNINSCLIVTSHFTCPLCLVITNKEKNKLAY